MVILGVGGAKDAARIGSWLGGVARRLLGLAVYAGTGVRVLGWIIFR